MTIRKRLCLALALLMTAGMISACNRGSESAVQRETVSTGKGMATTTAIAISDSTTATADIAGESGVSTTRNPEITTSGLPEAAGLQTSTAPVPRFTTRRPEEPTQPPTRSTIREVSPSEQIPVWLVDNETDCDELLTRTWSLSELSDDVNFSWLAPTFYMNRRKWVQDLHAAYPIECLRQMEDGRYYAIYKLEGGGRLYVFFADGGHYTHSLYWFPDENPDAWNHLRNVDIHARDAAQYDDQLAHMLAAEEDPQRLYRGNNAFLLEESTRLFHSVHYTEQGLVQIRYTLTEEVFRPNAETMLHAEVVLHEDYRVKVYNKYVMDFSILEQDMPV